MIAFVMVVMVMKTVNALLLLQSAIGSGGGMFSLLPLVLMVPVFYLLLILPNQRKQKKWQQMLGQVKAGDKVTTTGGLRGIVISVKDDAIQLRVPPDNLRIEVVKAAIASVTTDEEK
jgi:preprotein translocase subunit YajC